MPFKKASNCSVRKSHHRRVAQQGTVDKKLVAQHRRGLRFIRYGEMTDVRQGGVHQRRGGLAGPGADFPPEYQNASNRWLSRLERGR
jgi:hypothetical protein